MLLKTFFLLSVLNGSPLEAANIPRSITACTTPWFNHVREPNEKGADVELLEAFGKSLKLDVKVHEIAWSELFKRATSSDEKLNVFQGQCDFVAASISALPERAELLKIERVFPGKNLVVVRREDKGRYRSIQDLAGKRTAVVPSTSFQKHLDELNLGALKSNPIKIQLWPQGATIEVLRRHESDFELLDTFQALSLIRSEPNKFALAFGLGGSNFVGWGFPNKTSRFQIAFREFIRKSRANPDSDLNKIYKKYFGVDLEDLERLALKTL